MNFNYHHNWSVEGFGVTPNVVPSFPERTCNRFNLLFSLLYPLVTLALEQCILGNFPLLGWQIPFSLQM